ncbi:L,D-transpeptidase family protein [Nocardioides hankookensis]
MPGRGSGIFFHTSKPGPRGAPTAGCTQVGNPRQMRWLLTWLRPEARPRVVQDL